MFPSKPVVHVIEDSFLPTAQVIELYDIPYIGFEIIGKILRCKVWLYTKYSGGFAPCLGEKSLAIRVLLTTPRRLF